MRSLAEPVSNLIDAFSRLPGIGPKTASRLTYFLLRSDGQIALQLSDALRELKARTLFCKECHNVADTDPCVICEDAQRNQSIVCVVEEPLDVQAIERTGEFKGLYHVLHGAISPVEGISPEDLKIRELLTRVQKRRADPEAAQIQEILVATNPNLEGEATAMYLAQLCKPLGLRVTRLARGLPTGSDLEYADETTLSNALNGRSEM